MRNAIFVALIMMGLAGCDYVDSSYNLEGHTLTDVNGCKYTVGNIDDWDQDSQTWSVTLQRDGDVKKCYKDPRAAPK